MMARQMRKLRLLPAPWPIPLRARRLWNYSCEKARAKAAERLTGPAVGSVWQGGRDVQVLAMAFTLAVSVGLPLGALIYLLARRRTLLRPFLAGVGTFLLFQLLLRIPLLGWLQGWEGLALLAFRSPWLYAFFLALTAALFEEGGRYLAARLLLKGRVGAGEALAFGLGHWGLEALALVGLPLLLSLLAAPGLTLAAGAEGLLAVGVERVAALPVHLAATRLVFAGVRGRRALPLLAAFALHTLVDLLAALGALVGLPLWGIEGGLLAVAALLTAWMVGERVREGRRERGCR